MIKKILYAQSVCFSQFGRKSSRSALAQCVNLKGGVGEAEDGDWQEDGEHHTPCDIYHVEDSTRLCCKFLCISLFTLWTSPVMSLYKQLKETSVRDFVKTFDGWCHSFWFYLFSVSYSGVATSTLDIHYFAWGLCCGRFFEVDWKLVFAVELHCSDCVEIKVSRGNVPFPHWDSNPCLTYQWL